MVEFFSRVRGRYDILLFAPEAIMTLARNIQLKGISTQVVIPAYISYSKMQCKLFNAAKIVEKSLAQS